MKYSSIHQEIVLACQNGDRKAQFELYRLYSKAMYNLCLRMLRNELDAEDVLQHSFIDIFSKLNTFRFQSSIGAWIKRIVVNNCINFLKKKRLKFDELKDNLGHVSDTEDDASSRYSVAAIQDALLLLPDGYRVVFSLYCMEGYDHQEISEILGVSVATSKSQYSRAKQKMRQLLSQSHA
ncbi:MAG: sigma-70 family RNA polymerase sigma factor [Bacteroidota bacterium]